MQGFSGSRRWDLTGPDIEGVPSIDRQTSNLWTTRETPEFYVFILNIFAFQPKAGKESWRILLDGLLYNSEKEVPSIRRVCHFLRAVSLLLSIRVEKNSIRTCILSRVKQITSPGWMHGTSARALCSGKTQWDRVVWVVGGGIGMGNTCKSMADSCQCMTKTTTI